MPSLVHTVGVSKHYPSGGSVIHAVNDVSVSIERGEFVAISGRSGSGKSTLLNLLGLLERPDHGQYALNGRSVAKLSEDARANIRRQDIGFIFQVPALVPRTTALENVELPLVYAGVRRQERHRKAKDALDRVGLADRSHHWQPREDGSIPPVDLAIPLFGYQNHVSIDRRFGFIRRWAATDAATYEGRRLRQGLLDKSNTASGVWADTAYRSAANETFLSRNGLVSHIHRKKPKGRAMPETMRRANNAKSKIRARVEHVFAEQKHRMGLFVRTIGIARATNKIGMANLVYNIKRLTFLRNLASA
jgi:hypothetical protein